MENPDRGDLSYWDQLRSVSDEAMRQWCDNAKQQIKQVDLGQNVSEGIWSKWLAVHNEIAERGVGSRIKKQQQTKKPQIGHRDAQVQELARLKNELRKSLAKSQGEARSTVWSEYKKTKAELRKHMRDLRKQHDILCNKTLEQLEVKDPKGYYRNLKAFAKQEKSNQSLPTEMREGSALVGGIAASESGNKASSS